MCEDIVEFGLTTACGGAGRYGDGLRLMIVGDVYGDVRPYRQRIVDCGAADIIRFEDGYVPDETVEDHFLAADLVVLHRIYASARETDDASVDGRTLFQEVSRHHPRAVYFEEPEEAIPFFQETLKPGDLLVTMGAGDNWRIGREIFEAKVEAAQ